MAKYATGKYAKAISDRSGMEFPYKEMVREWNGSFVDVSEFEPKQPQLIQQTKLVYEDEFARALAEDGSASSTHITPKAYYPGA